jgi:hypothetical protein
LDAPAQDPRDESIGDLFSRLIDEGREYARAEIGLYREIAKRRAAQGRTGAIALAAGAGLLWFAGIAALLGGVLGLATLIGPLAAGLAVAALLGAGGLVLLRFGIGELRALRGDEVEKEALARAAEEEQ